MVKKLSKSQIGKLTLEEKIKYALESKNWMLRRSDDGESYGGFQWAPLGEWTIAPDWSDEPKCGGGLHGVFHDDEGYYTSGKNIDFCLVFGGSVKIDSEKSKVEHAMVLMRDQLPEGLSVGGYLDLSGTQITSLPEGLSVGGSLYLSGTQITSLPEGLSVGGSLDLSGTQITSLPEGLSVGGYLDLSGTQITSLPEGLSVGGYLYLSGTQITSLPEGLSEVA